MACVARVVDAEVGGDAIEPGAEACLGAVGLARAVDAQEDLLGKLLGDGLVVHHAVHEVDDGAAVLLDEEVEAGDVSGAQLQHDGGVFHLGEVRGALRNSNSGRKHTIEQARVDGQGCHIFRNPILVAGLRGGGKIRRDFFAGLGFDLVVGEGVRGSVDGHSGGMGRRGEGTRRILRRSGHLACPLYLAGARAGCGGGWVMGQFGEEALPRGL